MKTNIMTQFSISNLVDQVLKMILYLKLAPDFIRKNELWKGFMKNGILSKLSILFAAIVSYKFIIDVKNLIFTPAQTTHADVSFLKGISQISNEILFSGGMRYLILIALEIVIFHFAVKTHSIISGTKRELTVNEFFTAQIRMIKVALRSWVYEVIFSLCASIILGLLGLGLFETILVFLIQCFFLGVAFMDNYNEQFNVPIKESFKISYELIGATLVVGILAYILFAIPLMGVVLAPLICAVGTTLFMFNLPKPEISELS
jgi:uncharacterized protein involved in cysteine biosynthesis